MTCPHSQDAAAYVLGALSPAARLDFERHLPDCDRCTTALGEVAGLPGLLGRVDASVLERPPGVEPVPATALPALSRRVRRTQRRRTLAAAGVTAVLVAITASLTLWLSGDGADGPSSPPSAVVAREMDPVGEVPVRASVTLERVAWGTRLGLTCTYDPDSVEYGLPPSARYVLVVRTQDGAEQVGSWLSQGGTTMQLTAATAEELDKIRSVEVRTTDGRVVLRSIA